MATAIINGKIWQETVCIPMHDTTPIISEHEANLEQQPGVSYKALAFISQSIDNTGPHSVSLDESDYLFKALDLDFNDTTTTNNNNKHRKIYNLYCGLENGAKHVIMFAIDVTLRTRAKKNLVDVLEAEHAMLENMFPNHVLEYIARQRAQQDVGYILKNISDNQLLATRHDQVTVMFADITGFTPMCSLQEPMTVMSFLNNLFSRFDDLLDIFGVYKVETIGDCYVVAGGLMSKDDQGTVTVREYSDKMNAIKVVKFAKAVVKEARKLYMPGTSVPVTLRIGIHTGPLVSGIVGKRMPRFCMFGDTINIAARMEATAIPGTIHASEKTWSMTPVEKWIHNGPMIVKGKGEMQTYTLYVSDHNKNTITRQSLDIGYIDFPRYVHNGPKSSNI